MCDGCDWNYSLTNAIFSRWVKDVTGIIEVGQVWKIFTTFEKTFHHTKLKFTWSNVKVTQTRYWILAPLKICQYMQNLAALNGALQHQQQFLTSSDIPCKCGTWQQKILEIDCRTAKLFGFSANCCFAVFLFCGFASHLQTLICIDWPPLPTFANAKSFPALKRKNTLAPINKGFSALGWWVW